jgi:hypothetical protein
MSLSISSVFGAGAYWGKPFLPLALGALVAPSSEIPEVLANDRYCNTGVWKDFVFPASFA